MKTVSNEAHIEQCQLFMKQTHEALGWLANNAIKDPEEAGAIASPLLRMFALTTIAVMWARMAEVSESETAKENYADSFLSGKQKAADHFFRLYAPEMTALLAEVSSGKETLMAFAEDEF